MEYLLILIVAVVVVMMVWNFMSTSKEQTLTQESVFLRDLEFIYLLPLFIGSKHKLFLGSQ